jgi:hypothetical protein
LLLRAARAGTGGELGVHARCFAEAAVPGHLSALIHDPGFKEAAGEAVFSKARVINTLGNRAVHGHRAIPLDDALVAVRELFHVAYWLNCLADSDNLCPPEVIAQELVDDLEAALEQFRLIAGAVNGGDDKPGA